MQVEMKENDYLLFEKLVSMTQDQMKRMLSVHLKTKYNKVIVNSKYIVAVGDIPIALVSHMDTVFAEPVRDLYYDRKKGILWSPDGLGADDRAGIFSILKIISSGLRPSVIFTTDEEVGGIGAEELSRAECPIPNLKYFIELDRCGSNDCVFYCCGNDKFIDYVSSFGFVERQGSFTDISYLMPGWNKCGTNLSVGYENEHSYIETLHVGSLYATIEKVKRMLTEKIIPDFEFIEDITAAKWYSLLSKAESDTYYNDFDNITYLKCDKCGKYFPEYELFPVKGKNGDALNYCPDCMVDNVDWCTVCGKAYEVISGEGNKYEGVCPECYHKIKKAGEV